MVVKTAFYVCSETSWGFSGKKIISFQHIWALSAKNIELLEVKLRHARQKPKSSSLGDQGNILRKKNELFEKFLYLYKSFLIGSGVSANFVQNFGKMFSTVNQTAFYVSGRIVWANFFFCKSSFLFIFVTSELKNFRCLAEKSSTGLWRLHFMWPDEGFEELFPEKKL